VLGTASAALEGQGSAQCPAPTVVCCMQYASGRRMSPEQQEAAGVVLAHSQQCQLWCCSECGIGAHMRMCVLGGGGLATSNGIDGCLSGHK
jgi:hypothetical protein